MKKYRWIKCNFCNSLPIRKITNAHMLFQDVHKYPETEMKIENAFEIFSNKTLVIGTVKKQMTMAKLVIGPN